MTENIYQSLREFIPEDPAAGDTRSVHFLLFPDVKEEYFDAVIERQVKRMQTVIELTRVLRERHNLSLKVRIHRLSCILRERRDTERDADAITRAPRLPRRRRVARRRQVPRELHQVRAERPERRVHLRRGVLRREVPRGRGLARARP